MKALTVCQPYASLIVGWDGIDAGDVKRVENRTWATSCRGPLLIHAGRSTHWLHTWAGATPAHLPMGVILGCVDLVGCRSIESIRRAPKSSPIAWLKHHVHVAGPCCWILRRPRRLLRCIPYRGRQGLFDVPDEILAGADWEPQCRVCGCTALDACAGGAAVLFPQPWNSLYEITSPSAKLNFVAMALERIAAAENERGGKLA
jgi:hypothetical protein